MRKLISLLLLVVMMFTMCFTVTTFAEAADIADNPTFSVENVWSATNSTVKVNVLIADNPGIQGATLNISWADGLTLIDDKNGDIFGDLSYTSPSHYVSTGTNFVWYGNEAGEAEDGAVLTLTFKVAENVEESAKLAVNLTGNSIYNGNDKLLTPTFVNGSVFIVNYIPGDANSDGEVNTMDLTIISRYISDGCVTDPEGYNITLNENASDVNDDGAINTMDLTLISRYISDGCVTDPEGYNVILKPVTPRCKHTKQACTAKSATCTESGNIAYWYCDKCNKYFADALGEQEISYEDTVIPASHTFSEEWSYDETSHWHEATCEHKEEPVALDEHTFVNHICSVCSAEEKMLVTFVDGEGEVIFEQYVVYGSAATAPTVPERLGFVFEGWNISFNAVTQDITVTAQYAKAHVVTFLDYDNTILKQESVKEGGSATAYVFTEADVIPEGFERTGWDKEFNNITEDTYVTATYAKKKYTVTFYMPDGSLIGTQTVEHGSVVEAPECSDTYFDWNNYKMGEFSGWSKSLKDIKGDTSITAEYNNEYAQPVISIDTTANSASIKMYTPESCYLYAMDFGFNWSGNISILSCDKNIASDLYKGNNGASNIDYNNKYNKFHYTWTNAVGIKLEAAYTTVLDIQFATDGNQTVNKDVIKLFDNCSIIYSTTQTTDMSKFENVKPIVVIR